MDERVLVLNANFEPVNVCDMRRAIGLMINDKATLVENGRGVIQTTRNSFPRPSVIRLKKMVHRPRIRVKLTRREVFHRDNYTCQYCGKHTTHLTIDHVKPRHLGGTQTWTNIVTACSSCNHHKGGRTLEEANMHLLAIPKEPPLSAYYIFGRHLRENAEWEAYIIGW
jgi:5-methylcytosine-specific restriction endonuclease McrA